MRKATSPLICISLLAYLTVTSAQSRVPEISSSVLVFGPSDYVLNGGQSRCQTVVRNALANRQSTLMFVPTAFWVDNGYASLKSVNSQVPPSQGIQILAVSQFS